MIESQAVQPPLYVDTSFLLVGHVDETLSFLPVSSPRGWILLINDARLARKMLEAEVAAGRGDVKMFVGLQTYGPINQLVSAERTLSEVLADTALMNQSAIAAAAVDAQLAILKAETGITDAEIVRVPFLHERVGGAGARVPARDGERRADQRERLRAAQSPRPADQRQRSLQDAPGGSARAVQHSAPVGGGLGPLPPGAWRGSLRLQRGQEDPSRKLVGEWSMSARSWICLGVAIFTSAGAPASGGGLLLTRARLPPPAARSLEAEISAARLANPAAFRAVAELGRSANALDEGKRGPVAPMARALKPLGPAGLMPMLELSALRSPAGLSESAALSLELGLIEAVGQLRDPRAAPVLWGVLSLPDSAPPGHPRRR